MTALRKAVEQYLRVRRALGFKLEREGQLLPEFASFVKRHGSAYVTTHLSVRWAMKPQNASAGWWQHRLTMVRAFAKYLAAIDPRTEIAPRESIPRPAPRRSQPYIYSRSDVSALMEAAGKVRGLKGATYTTLLGLLSATGMRVGEALALDRSDVDWHQGLLVVRNAKFGKSRQVVLHPSTIQALRRYARTRDRALPHPRSPSFLLSLAGTRLIYANVQCCFRCLVRMAGLPNQRPHRPRIHDLRHTFAITTLVDWYRAGVDVEPRLAALSTYLGHVCPSNTYWYLTATPELLKLASSRFEDSLGELP